ncbi:MAG TPA: cation:proton antiporter [Bacteroidales bacterium]|mgnify:CR=1 FL=1|nr:cation:proton antiporter [Bacteroidales bacterium]
MDFLAKFQLPITDSVLVFLLIFVIIFLAPRLLKKIRIPGIVVFILAGVLIGPHGLNIIAPVNGVNMLSEFGLLYIMFLVGLEIDLVDFKKHRSRSAVFGSLTFIIPLTLGFFVTHYILELDFLASLLVASMFSTHTLVSYPIASRLGITKNRVINTVIGGTIITDTAVLLLLVIIEKVFQGTLETWFWIVMIFSLTAFMAIMLWVVPAISRWFFKNLEGDGSAQYLYVLCMLFASAFLAKTAGIEPMVGAFMAGLALNSLVPSSSVLMNRTVFIGNTIFIPFFLIGVGMIVDLRVFLNGTQALIIAGLLVVTAEVTKYIAAFFTQKIYKFSVVERNVLFGLSSSHAAATIALIMVGFNLKIIDINVLNGTVVVIFVSCLISSFVTENAGRKLARIEKNKPVKEDTMNQRILVPMSKPENMQMLINFALFLKNKNSKEPLYTLNVFTGNPDSEESRYEILVKNRQIADIISQTVPDERLVRSVSRIDVNVANGINRAIKELMITNVVIGWNGQSTGILNLFGGIVDNILPKNNQMMFIVKVMHPFGYFKRIVLIVPPNAEFEPGFKKWLRQIAVITKELTAKVLIFATEDTTSHLIKDFDKSKTTSVHYVKFNDYDNMNALKDHLSHNDLLFWISARENTISHSGFLSALPRQLSKNFIKYSFVIVYPEQHSFHYQNVNLSIDGLTKSPIKENIDRLTKIGRTVKKAIKGKP